MYHQLTRRTFLKAGVGTGVLGALGAVDPSPSDAADDPEQRPPSPGTLVLNDDGHVFLNLSDDLHKADLRRYLQSYCRAGVDTVAYCVGDMSWPTLYPTRVGVHYRVLGAAGDVKRVRSRNNVDNFASEPGGYFGAVFGILRELGKNVLASFRMNDAHFTSVDNPNVSEFWKQHAKRALGRVYGYYGGCLNYEFDVVRQHFFDRVIEFAELYPAIDGIELDAMRSPYFFPPGKGKELAPLFTELVRRIKAALAAQAKRLKRPEYLLTINVPLTPELALESGLDVAAWDAERLFHSVSVGPYQAHMNHPMERWQKLLRHGTPVMAYVGCSPQTGQYLGLEEYRAAAANAYGSGADGIYLFNYPCLFELAFQKPIAFEDVKMVLPDMRAFRHYDFTKVAQALDEMGSAESLRGKDKRFLFYFSNDARYRHYDPDLASLNRSDVVVGSPDPTTSTTEGLKAAPGDLAVRPVGRSGDRPTTQNRPTTENSATLKATFRCYEDLDRARTIMLRFKIENVARTEQFRASLNGQPIAASHQQIRYAANGRDTRIHTVKLGPYQEYKITLQPVQFEKGENRLEVTPTKLLPELTTEINLLEIELLVRYAE